MLERATLRALPLLNKVGDVAPVAPACCNACRTCLTTNVAGVLTVAATGFASTMSRLLGRRG